MTAVLQQVHQDSTASSLQPSLFAGLFPTLSPLTAAVIVTPTCGLCMHDSSQLSPFIPVHTVCLSFPGHGLLPAELSAVEGVSKQVSGLQ